MKKTVSALVLLCLAAFMANAQWKVTSVAGSEPSTKLLQIVDADNSTLVYASINYNSPDYHLLRLSRNTCVKVDGMKYKILNSVNLPLHDDADQRYAKLQPGENEINFVMEFEKFPVKNGFDIIESSTDGAWNFNFHDVSVKSVETSELVDTKRFLDSGVPVITGLFAENGDFFLYYIREGVCITCNAVQQDGGWFTKDELFYVDIVNNSNHGVMFDFDKVTVVGSQEKKDGQTETKEWTKFTPDSYDQYLQEVDWNEARYKTFGVLDIVGHKIDLDRNQYEYNSWERVGMEALSVLKDRAIDNRVNEYLKENPKDRPAALKSQSLKAGESAHGYIAAKKDKKAGEVLLTIPMDGYDFSFNFSLK